MLLLKITVFLVIFVAKVGRFWSTVDHVKYAENILQVK